MPNPITADCLSEIGSIQHGFSRARAGLRRHLQLARGTGSADARERVLENRRVAAHFWGTTVERLLTCHQIHSASAVIVEAGWAIGQHPKADGMVTKVPGLALGALAADCAPVLFADPVAKWLAA
ncbi:MAG: laccase domain-containing protein [Hyphomicrobiaceae bacterium]